MNKELSVDGYRIIGIVKGVVEVERVPSDSDEYYKGFCDGIRASYKEETPNPVETSKGYVEGYITGYAKGATIAWDDIAEVEDDDFFDDWKPLSELEAEGFECPFELKLSEEYHRGVDHGFKRGYTEGEKEIRNYNVVLDGEMIEEFLDLKNFVLSYTKEPHADHLEHNRQFYAIHRKVMEVVDTWAMNQILDYMVKVDDEKNEE